MPIVYIQYVMYRYLFEKHYDRVEKEEEKASKEESSTALEQELVQLLAQEEDPLTAVTRVSRLLEGVVSQDTATLLLQKVRKSARFHLVLDAGAASGRLTVHKAVMKLLPPSKTTLALLGMQKSTRLICT
jgi:hypothetical protein